MIPLRLGQGGSFVAGSRGRPRTFWLCKNPTCIARLMKKPNQLLRAPHAVAHTPELVEQELSEYWVARARAALISAQNSGLIVHGSQRVRSAGEQNLMAIVFSKNAGVVTRAQISKIHNGIETFIFPDSSEKIGRLLRRGPRSVLALRDSRRTQSLIDTLRVGCSLG